jgi:hypothetical protein
MYALPALTRTAAEAVSAQFGPYEPPAPAREPGRRSHRCGQRWPPRWSARRAPERRGTHGPA